MDLNTLRIGVTLMSFAVFLGIVVWAYQRRSREDFEQLALLPFLNDGCEKPLKAGDANE